MASPTDITIIVNDSIANATIERFLNMSVSHTTELDVINTIVIGATIILGLIIIGLWVFICIKAYRQSQLRVQVDNSANEVKAALENIDNEAKEKAQIAWKCWEYWKSKPDKELSEKEIKMKQEAWGFITSLMKSNNAEPPSEGK